MADYISGRLINAVNVSELQKQLNDLNNATTCLEKEKQDKLVDSQNIRSVDNISLLGSGNIPFKTFEGQRLTGEGNIELKTLNGENLVGPGNIETEPLKLKVSKNRSDAIIYNGTEAKELSVVTLDTNQEIYSDKTFINLEVPGSYAKINYTNLTINSKRPEIVLQSQSGISYAFNIDSKKNQALINWTDLNNELSYKLALPAENGILATNNEVEDLQSQLNTEVTRAIEAEQLLQNNITTEEARALEAEHILQNNINAEVDRAVNREHDLQEAINLEGERALNAEELLQNNITAEELRASIAEEGLSTALSEEVTRATTAERQLQEKLTTEVNRATAAETGLNNRLTKVENTYVTLGTEQNISGHKNFDTNITFNYNEAKEASHGVLFNSLSNHPLAAVYAISSSDSDSDSDEEEALNIDSLGSINLNAEKVYYNDEEVAINKNLQAETRRAITAEESLSGMISAETDRATEAEGLLWDGLASEIGRARAAETDLSGDISAEETRAITAEGTLQNNINTLDANVIHKGTAAAPVAEEIRYGDLTIYGTNNLVLPSLVVTADEVSIGGTSLRKPISASKFIAETGSVSSYKAQYEDSKIIYKIQNSGTYTAYDLSFPAQSGTIAVINNNSITIGETILTENQLKDLLALLNALQVVGNN